MMENPATFRDLINNSTLDERIEFMAKSKTFPPIEIGDVYIVTTSENSKNVYLIADAVNNDEYPEFSYVDYIRFNIKNGGFIGSISSLNKEAFVSFAMRLMHVESIVAKRDEKTVTELCLEVFGAYYKAMKKILSE